MTARKPKRLLLALKNQLMTKLPDELKSLDIPTYQKPTQSEIDFVFERGRGRPVSHPSIDERVIAFFNSQNKPLPTQAAIKKYRNDR